MITTRNRLNQATLATAISLAIGHACADAVPRGKIRLALDSEISSRPEIPPVEKFDGRISVSGLIQSHPNPLYLVLEKRYKALPPFTMAEEDIPGELIAEATLQERLRKRARNIADGIPRFMPTVSSTIRRDDLSQDGEPDLSILMASISPTFEYDHELRKWGINATYRLDSIRYSGDRTGNYAGHTASVDYILKINRQSELNVSSLVSRTHERSTRDPIVDYDSRTQSDELEQDRMLLNLSYQRGTERDRSRYNVYYLAEVSDVNGEEFLNSGYRFDRNGFGGMYAWQFRRKMSLVAEGRYQDYDYDLNFLDNSHYKALVGSDLVFGRRLRAKFRLGYEGKQFDVAASTFGMPVWQGSVEWAPRRKTTLRFETGREIYELVTEDQNIDASTFNVRNWVKTAWHERWSDMLSTETSYTYRDTTITGGIDEDETAQQLILSVVYRLTDNLMIALDGAFTRETSNLTGDLVRRTFTLRTDYKL